ncbi:RpnC/YadD family protein [Pedobacter africanus]|uniref:Transposase, YhgA-like n=1 Tax=Pedobacter africanus TaxID=151894 RepID=A0A1W1Z908_9SPHI|nr:hypothetical protein [Pedobacter africanus]SMC44930.1 hypothetical protein SAMN04488524_0492 [Pedobacter africanus]
MPEEISLIPNKVTVRKKPHKKNDELLKGAFEENFYDFLRFMYADADEVIDFEKGIEFMDKELHTIIPLRERRKGKRQADLLAKLYLKDGTEKWILLNVEIEGSNDRYNVSVATIAVFTGPENQSRQTAYKDQLLGTTLSFTYLTYNIFDHPQQTLIALRNPFALIILACQKAILEGKIPDEELGQERLTIAKALLAQNYDHDRIISFMWFLKNFIFIDNQDINCNFDQQIETLTGGKLDMGIIETIKMQERREGIAEGRHEEALEIAREMKKDKFPTETIAKLTKLSIKEIEELKK